MRLLGGARPVRIGLATPAHGSGHPPAFIQGSIAAIERLRVAQIAVAPRLVTTGARNAAGIQTVCWDQRVEPIPTTGRGGRGGGGGGDGAPINLYAGPPSGGPPAPAGAVAVGSGPIPGYPTPMPTIGHLPEFPCGFAGGRGGGGAGAGPQVPPGTYSVALVAGGKTLETKSIKVVMDPPWTPDRMSEEAKLELNMF